MSAGYDLTQLLLTIAAASASIAAILGGFIASKLISINSEREAVLSRIAEVEQRQKHKQSELLEIQNSKTEEAAIDFITSNIDSLVEMKALSEVYRNDVQQEISIDALAPYWGRALSLLDELASSDINEGEMSPLNEDDLPKVIAVKYSNDEFAYTVCKKAVKHIIQEHQKTTVHDAILIGEYNIGEIGQVSSALETERMNALKSELSWLEYQGQQLQYEKSRLSKPKGMKGGLVVFALFSILCIIAPLSLAPLIVNDRCVFLIWKISIIAVFTIGLTTVFMYLAYLLKWKEKKND